MTQKRIMSYTSRDFLLFTYSLLLFLLISVLALGNTWVLYLVCFMLAFLFFNFIYIHGIKLDFSSVGLLLVETCKYPLYFFQSLKPFLVALSPIFCSYIAAVIFEQILTPYSNHTFLVNPLPYLWLFYFQFLVVFIYRTIVLFAHLKKHALVKEILDDSPWKYHLKRGHIVLHIFQAYITGTLAQIGLVLPVLAFFLYTSPTYLREVLIIFFYVLFQSVYYVKYGYTVRKLPYSIDNLAQWFIPEHERAHNSRFYFTVFHGHHHDAIPSGLIGSGGFGLVEAIHLSIMRLHFFHSATLFFIFKVPLSALHDILTHQYIPGVYPYSKYVLETSYHHAIHHFFSYFPISPGFAPYIDYDMKNGYSPNNQKAAWFAQAVKKYENIEDENIVKEYCEKPTLEKTYKLMALPKSIPLSIIVSIFLIYS